MAAQHTTPLTAQDIARFWSHVDKSGECWLWTKGKDKDGYGCFSLSFGSGKPGKKLRAHRIAYLIAHGIIDDALMVLHTCDNPPCVKPDHLYQGTGKNNSDDREQKGHTAKGHATGRPRDSDYATLTQADVIEIRKLIAEGVTLGQIAHSSNVRHSTIWHIAKGNTWKWIT